MITICWVALFFNFITDYLTFSFINSAFDINLQGSYHCLSGCILIAGKKSRVKKCGRRQATDTGGEPTALFYSLVFTIHRSLLRGILPDPLR